MVKQKEAHVFSDLHKRVARIKSQADPKAHIFKALQHTEPFECVDTHY